jgi:hypothetical protein
MTASKVITGTLKVATISSSHSLKRPDIPCLLLAYKVSTPAALPMAVLTRLKFL